MDSTKKRMYFETRLQKVWQAIFEAQEPLTIAEIAKVSGLTRSPYLREIVDLLYSRRYLDRGFDLSEKGRSVVVYWTVNDPSA